MSCLAELPKTSRTGMTNQFTNTTEKKKEKPSVSNFSIFLVKKWKWQKTNINFQQTEGLTNILKYNWCRMDQRLVNENEGNLSPDRSLTVVKRGIITVHRKLLISLIVNP